MFGISFIRKVGLSETQSNDQSFHLGLPLVITKKELLFKYYLTNYLNISILRILQLLKRTVSSFEAYILYVLSMRQYFQVPTMHLLIRNAQMIYE